MNDSGLLNVDSKDRAFKSGILTNYRWPSMPELRNTIVDLSNEQYSQEDDYGYQSGTYYRGPNRVKQRPNLKGK